MQIFSLLPFICILLKDQVTGDFLGEGCWIYVEVCNRRKVSPAKEEPYSRGKWKITLSRPIEK